MPELESAESTCFSHWRVSDNAGESEALPRPGRHAYNVDEIAR